MKKNDYNKILLDYIFKNATWKQLFILFYWYCFKNCKFQTFARAVDRGMAFDFALKFAKI